MHVHSGKSEDLKRGGKHPKTFHISFVKSLYEISAQSVKRQTARKGISLPDNYVEKPVKIAEQKQSENAR